MRIRPPRTCSRPPAGGDRSRRRSASADDGGVTRQITLPVLGLHVSPKSGIPGLSCRAILGSAIGLAGMSCQASSSPRGQSETESESETVASLSLPEAWKTGTQGGRCPHVSNRAPTPRLYPLSSPEARVLLKFQAPELESPSTSVSNLFPIERNSPGILGGLVMNQIQVARPPQNAESPAFAGLPCVSVGAAEGSRTPNLRFTKPLLCH